MTNNRTRTLLIAWVVALSGGCQTGTVVLLPEKDGKDTAVVVKQRDAEC